MIVTCVHIYVKKEHIADFQKASLANHKGSIGEAGNLRFDVLQSDEDPTRFMLYEAYESEEAAKQHKNTPHYLQWKDTVAPWMDKPREGVRYHVVAPLERNLW